MDAQQRASSVPQHAGASAGGVRARLGALIVRITDSCMPVSGPRDPIFVERARTAIGICYVVIPVCLLSALAQASGFGDLGGGSLGRAFVLLNLGGALAMGVALLLLRRWAALTAAVCLVTTYFTAFHGFVTYVTGGPLSPVAYYLLVMPTALLLTAGHAAALVWLGVELGILGGLQVLHASGHGYPFAMSQAEHDQLWLVCTWGLALIMVAIVWAFDRARATALAMLEQANGELELARHAADAANQSQSEFLSTMSHEIRTPLTAVLGFGDIALEQSGEAGLSEDDRLAVTTIGHSARNLLKIVDDLLDLANIETGRVEIRPTRQRVEDVLAGVVELLRPQAEARGVPLVVERVPGAADSLETDGLRLQQVLVNLVANAIKFSNAGRVHLAVRPLSRAGQPWIRFEVQDSGIGMTPEQLAGLFRPFSQAEASTARRFGGTGLGLSVSALLVENMGGEIAAESRPGHGSTFRVDLPLISLQRSPQASRPAAPAATPEGGEAAALRRLDCRVLVVDDTQDNRRLIKHFLSRAGAEVETAEGGEEALRQFELARQAGAPPDVVVMDIQMPGMDGFATRRALRAAGCLVPIIALTAHAMASERGRCLGAGFDDYASKPIDRAALVEFVARNLEDAPSPRPVAKPDAPSAVRGMSRLRALVETLVAWLVPPHAPNAAMALRQTRTLLLVAVAPLTVVPLEVYLMLRVMPMEITHRMLPLVVAAGPLCAVLPLVYRWSGSIALPSNAAAAYIAAIMLAMAYYTGGVMSGVPNWLVLIPMASYAIAGARSALFWLGVALASDVGFWALSASGVTLRNYASPETLAFGKTMNNVGLACLTTLLAIVHERAKNEAIETLASANRWLEDARGLAERAGRTKSMFLANISHELRTPMTAILGFADLLSERARTHGAAVGLSASVIDSLHTIRSSGRRLLALINDLLDLAKVEAGSLRIESLELDPAELLTRTLEPLRAAAQAKGLVLELSAQLPARIAGDPLRLAQIVTKLCDNAIKFTRQGRVSVDARVRRAAELAWLEISVADTGCGIPAEHLPTLFSAFHQVDSSIQRERGGSGLGLALCRRLAECMGGSIQVASQLGVGSRFALELPLCAGAAPAAPSAAVAPTRRGPSGLRLLLAEDGRDNQRLIARVLRDAGAEVDVVGDGRLAVERGLAGKPYDLILMDVEMPLLDGLAAARALRDAGYTAPILALTAHDLSEERERCLAEGCDGVAAKPVDWPRLFEQMDALCTDPDGKRADQPLE